MVQILFSHFSPICVIHINEHTIFQSISLLNDSTRIQGIGVWTWGYKILQRKYDYNVVSDLPPGGQKEIIC